MAKPPYQVIRCPNTTHSHPKTLVIVGENKIFVQCADMECKKTSENRGWYEIGKENAAWYIRPVPKGYHFSLEETAMPVLNPKEKHA